MTIALKAFYACVRFFIIMVSPSKISHSMGCNVGLISTSLQVPFRICAPPLLSFQSKEQKMCPHCVLSWTNCPILYNLAYFVIISSVLQYVSIFYKICFILKDLISPFYNEESFRIFYLMEKLFGTILNG